MDLPASDFSSVLDAFRDPQMRHSIAVHMPVALSVLGVLVTLLAVALGWARRSFIFIAVGTYALLVLSALIAVNTGEDADAELKSNLPAEVFDIVHHHEELAEKVWIFSTLTAVLLLGLLVRVRWLYAGCAALGLAGAVFTAGWVGFTAHHGGTLVYEWGVGTPKPIYFDESTPGGVTDPDDDSSDSDEVDPASPTPDVISRTPVETFFVEHVRPILSENCWQCHNNRRARAGLNQMSRASLLAGGDSGPAIVPGKPEESLLITAVSWTDPDLQMPPKGPQLAPEQIAALEQWIRDGATWVELDTPDQLESAASNASRP